MRLPCAMRNIRSWHLQTTLSERRSPPFQHVDHHAFGTSATMLAEDGMFCYKKTALGRVPPAKGLQMLQQQQIHLCGMAFDFCLSQTHKLLCRYLGVFAGVSLSCCRQSLCYSCPPLAVLKVDYLNICSLRRQVSLSLWPYSRLVL